MTTFLISQRFEARRSSFDEDSVDGGSPAETRLAALRWKESVPLAWSAWSTEIGLVIWAQRAHRILMKL